MIDRELQRALDVDPSPEFLARVRQRIAAEPPPRRWAWTIVPVCAAAVLVLAVVVNRPREPTNRVTSAAPAAALAARTLVDSTAVVSVPTPRPRRVRLESATPRRAVVAAAAPSVQVLISEAESRAIRNLIAGLRDGRIDPASLPANPSPPADIVIPPIVITPAITGEGVRQ